MSDIDPRFADAEERTDGVMPKPLPFDPDTPPDVPCRACGEDCGTSEHAIFRGRRWYCSDACAGRFEPEDAA